MATQWTRCWCSKKTDFSNANDEHFDGGEFLTQLPEYTSGTTTGGVDLKLSFVGSYNPITTFTTPASNDQLDITIDLLDAYRCSSVRCNSYNWKSRCNWGGLTYYL